MKGLGGSSGSFMLELKALWGSRLTEPQERVGMEEASRKKTQTG